MYKEAISTKSSNMMMCQIFVQQKADGLTLVERRSEKEYIMLKASPATGKVHMLNLHELKTYTLKDLSK